MGKWHSAKSKRIEKYGVELGINKPKESIKTPKPNLSILDFLFKNIESKLDKALELAKKIDEINLQNRR